MRLLKRVRSRVTVLTAALLIVALLAVMPKDTASNAAAAKKPVIDIYAKRVPDVNTNLLAAATRQATGAQLAALDKLYAKRVEPGTFAAFAAGV